MAFRSLARLSIQSKKQAVRSFNQTSSKFSTLVIADHDNKTLNESALSVVTAAEKLGVDIHVLVSGSGCEGVAKDASKISGVKSVFLADDNLLANGVAENLTKLVLKLHKEHKFTNILAAGASVGKGVVPRVCASLDVAPISEVISVVSKDTFVRPIYAGNALCTVQSKDAVKVMTIRPTSFPKAETAGSASVVSVRLDDINAGQSKWVRDMLSVSERPELASASIVVSGGRALGSADNFSLIHNLADSLGAAVGASRAAVDAGYAPNDQQVGQTGKVVAPDLYIAVGISGAIQHLAGMKDSKAIVAINKDVEAPIFQVADYGIVGDLFTVVPDLTAKVKAARA